MEWGSDGMMERLAEVFRDRDLDRDRKERIGNR